MKKKSGVGFALRSGVRRVEMDGFVLIYLGLGRGLTLEFVIYKRINCILIS